MSTTTTGATAGYLTEVRAELADLPATELEEVLDDVAGHLDEIARELEAGGNHLTAESLTARLGTPHQYAEELRAAAGYPAKVGPVTGRPARRALAWGAVAAVLTPLGAIAWLAVSDADLSVLVWLAIGLAPAAIGIRALHGQDPQIVTTTPAWSHSSDWFRRLAGRLPAWLRREAVTIGQPLWWVARGSIGGVAIFALTLRGTGGWPLAAVLGALASIWLGRRSQRDRRLLWFLVPLNLVAALAMLLFAYAIQTGFPSLGYWLTSPSYAQSSGTGSAAGASGLALDGRPVDNVFPFDQQGKPLSNVRLYDASGRPLNLGSEHCDTRGGSRTTWRKDNLYPKSIATVSADGSRCTQAATPPLVVPPLTPTPTPRR